MKNIRIVYWCDVGFREAICFLAIVIVSGVLSVLVQDRWSTLSVLDISTSSSTAVLAIETGRVELLDLKDVLRFGKEEGVLLVDVRDEKYYLNGHIENAINIPWSEIDSVGGLGQLNIDFDKYYMIIVYCQSPTCNKAFAFAHMVRDERNVKIGVYESGYTEWLSLKLPTGAGAKKI